MDNTTLWTYKTLQSRVTSMISLKRSLFSLSRYEIKQNINLWYVIVSKCIPLECVHPKTDFENDLAFTTKVPVHPFLTYHVRLVLNITPYYTLLVHI